MYKQAFGTDWNDLTRDEAIRRAFALGVAAGVGSERPTELKRVLAAFESGYDRSVIELAYDEGRTKALDAVRATDDPDPDTVWAALVSPTGVPQRPPISTALPGALTKRQVADRPVSGPPESLDFPSMFRK